ncbi:MAG: glycosyltransferase [Desulfobacteraceae bacterium]|nr:glycosyltransferase [Desulfobacteraceae bacterium]
MKILNVNMSIDPVRGGGTAERTVQITKALSALNCDCSLLTLDIGITSELKKSLKNVKLILLKCINKRFYIPGFDFNIIKENVKNSDFVHLMGHWTLINVLVYYYIKKYKKPYSVCPAGALPFYGRSKLLKNFYNLIIGKKIIRNSDKCIGITENERYDFYSYRVPDQKIISIPNGINIEDYKFKNNQSFKKKYNISKKFILFLGRLNHIKGPDILLNAFIDLKEKIQDYQLLIIGPDEGMLDEMMKKVKSSNNFDDIIFAGYVGGQEKSKAYHAADLVVIPSRQEAMSIVVLEAGITGTPVVITDQCGFDEIGDVNGGIVVPATIEGVKSGIKEMLADPDKLVEKGNNLKQFCKRYYTWAASAKKYYEIHKQFI